MKTYRAAPSQGFLWLWGIALLMLAGVVPIAVAQLRAYLKKG